MEAGYHGSRASLSASITPLPSLNVNPLSVRQLCAVPEPAGGAVQHPGGGPMRTLIVRQSQPVRLSALLAVLAQVLAEHGDLSVVTEGMTTCTLEYATL